MSRFSYPVPEGATHYLYSDHADIFFYYKHDPNNGIHGFHKFNPWLNEWRALKQMPKDWNSRYEAIELKKEAKADTEG